MHFKSSLIVFYFRLVHIATTTGSRLRGGCRKYPSPGRGWPKPPVRCGLWGITQIYNGIWSFAGVSKTGECGRIPIVQSIRGEVAPRFKKSSFAHTSFANCRYPLLQHFCPYANEIRWEKNIYAVGDFRNLNLSFRLVQTLLLPSSRYEGPLFLNGQDRAQPSIAHNFIEAQNL